MPRPRITIFTDFTSAASYVTEVAAWRCARANELEIDCRAVTQFEVGVTQEATPEKWAEIQTLAAELELILHPQAMPATTGKAHELARFAKATGLEEEIRKAVYAAYWASGRDIGRIDVLQAIAAEQGLDPVDVKIALDIDRFRDEVARDDRIASRLNIRTAPVVYFGSGSDARVLTGAQSVESLERLVQEVIEKHE